MPTRPRSGFVLLGFINHPARLIPNRDSLAAKIEYQSSLLTIPAGRSIKHLLVVFILWFQEAPNILRLFPFVT